MKKKLLTEEILINLWMEKYHGITIEEAYDRQPWTDSREFYEMYKCTQEQHDAWEIEAKEMFRKHFGLSKSRVDREFSLTYLNTSPMVMGANET